MVKQTIKIKGITEKQGKTGQKYFVIDTEQGTMSCFPDYTGLQMLRDAWRNDTIVHVNVETSEDGKFQNIRNESKNKPVSPQNAFNEVPQAIAEARKSVKGSAYEKDPVGLAVEVFNALIDCPLGDKQPDNSLIMQASINLVKQAQKAFS